MGEPVKRNDHERLVVAVGSEWSTETAARACWAVRHRDPTTADPLAAVRALPRAERVALVRELLQGAPDEAVEVVAGLRVAGPWQWGEHPDADAGRYCGRAVVALVGRQTFGPRQWVVGRGPILPRGFATREEAMAAADAALVSQGWALAGEVRRG